MTRRAFFRDMLKYLPSMLFPALTGFISAPILTRLFLPSEYADYVLALGASDFLFALAISGIASVPVRFYPAYNRSSERRVFFSTISLSSGLVILGACIPGLFLLFLLRSRISPSLFPLLLISVLIFAIQSLYRIFSDVARAQHKSGTYSTFELLYRYGSLAIGLLLVVVFGLHIDGLLWGEVLALGLSVPFLIILTTRGVRIRLEDYRAEDARLMWKFAWPLSVGNIAMWGLRLSDRYILSFFRSAHEVGQYSIAYNISSRSIDLFVMLIILTMGPIIMNTWESQGRKPTEEALSLATRMFLILGVPAIAGLSLLSLPLVSLLTSPPYYEGHRIVGYVAFSSFAWGLSLMASYGSLITKDTRRIAVNQILAAALTIALNLALVPRYGFVAAGINASIGFFVLALLQAHASERFLSWHFPMRTLRNTLIAAFAMAVVLFLANTLQLEHHYSLLAFLPIAILGAMAIYFSALLLLGEATAEETALIRQIANRLISKKDISSK